MEDYNDVHILHINDVSPEDAGTIRCIASLPKLKEDDTAATRRHSREDIRSERSAELDGAAGSRTNSEAIRICCTAELNVIVSDNDLFRDEERSAVSFSDSVTTSMDVTNKDCNNFNSNDNSAADSCDDNMNDYKEDDGFYLDGVEEPAIILRGPQDTTALVGDRVLLKATYIGQPEPSVRWTRAVSILRSLCFFLLIPIAFCIVIQPKLVFVIVARLFSSV